MMLDFLGNGDARYQAAHDGILAAIEQVIASGPKTPDMKGMPRPGRSAKPFARRFCANPPPRRRAAGDYSSSSRCNNPAMASLLSAVTSA
jgi:tartrate dehydrogenase/decarboxylase/D-malate dehydrogenase